MSAFGEPRVCTDAHIEAMLIKRHESPTFLGAELTPEMCQRIVEARDPRYDGVLFVAITTTRVYCRPVCPARVVHADRRRFFSSAAAAEHAGYRPCLRCRPELAPGRALCDAVSRLAHAAAQRIAAGALNGGSVAQLARTLCVSERHLRRALERELGVSPVELAQTHRLLLAKRLLADTNLSITRIAYVSGFQSLRRFNTVFRERYRIAPNALRRARRVAPIGRNNEHGDLLQLTLSYRAPFAWRALLAHLNAEAIAGVEVVDAHRYGRTVRLSGVTGIVIAEDENEDVRRSPRQKRSSTRDPQLNISLSASLLPALMPLLARLRQLFDLDAQPSVIDAHLAHGGLGDLVRVEPGVRVPGTLDGFEMALRVLLGVHPAAGAAQRALAQRVIETFGEPIDTGFPGLSVLAPEASRIAEAAPDRIARLGVAKRRASAIVALARMVADGTVKLESGADVSATRSALEDGARLEPDVAAMIIMRALHWPDAFPASDHALQAALGVAGRSALIEHAQRWRPWRAYGALRLWQAPEGLVLANGRARYAADANCVDKP
jgi:AraC family transcriptional regulator of adaptative response / DNA-3-methyladenine glycosylase II